MQATLGRSLGCLCGHWHEVAEVGKQGGREGEREEGKGERKGGREGMKEGRRKREKG